MLALDTNVLVRYLAQDDVKQSAAATRLIAGILSDLLDTSVLELQDAAAVRAALPRDRVGGVELHDCLIVGLAEQRGARVVTLDAKAAKRLGMELLR